MLINFDGALEDFNAVFRVPLAEHTEFITLLNDVLGKVNTMAVNQTELAAELNELATSVGKLGTETGSLVTKIAELEAAVIAAGNISPEVNDALASVKAQVKVVDDLVPDAVPTVPDEPATV